MDSWVWLVLALALGALMPPTVRPLLVKLNLVDIPNERSSHTQATLRGAGVAVGLTIAFSWLIKWPMGVQEQYFGSVRVGWVLITAMVLYAALGFAEDVVHLSVAVRMTGQFAIAFSAALVVVAWSSGLLGPEVVLPAVVLGLLLGLSAVFVVNAANFMDGINGISALHGVIAGGNAWIIGILSGWDDLILTGSLVLVAFLGFLGWNFPKARMFLGDSGSYLLGAAQWGLGWAAFSATGNPVVGLAPVAIYSADVVVTLVRRAIRKVNLTQSHREHGYQLIAAAFGSHIPATAITTIASALNCGLAIWSWQVGNPWVGVAGMLLVCLGYELIALVWVPRRAKP